MKHKVQYGVLEVVPVEALEEGDKRVPDFTFVGAGSGVEYAVFFTPAQEEVNDG